MIKVLDSNYLTSKSLEDYLLQDKSNRVVVTDYLAMEAHKNFKKERYMRLMSILMRFPQQVLVAKPTSDCSKISRGTIEQIRSSIISNDCFSLYSKNILNMSREVEMIMKENSDLSDNHLQKMLNAAEELPAIFKDMASPLSKQDLAAIRDNGIYTKDTKYAVNFYWERLTEGLINQNLIDHPRDLHETVNCFIARNSLCVVLLAMDWQAQGGALNAKMETIRNDMVDAIIVSYATYFDGLLSDDTRMNRIYLGAQHFISEALT